MASNFFNRIKERCQLVSTFTYPIIVVVTALLVVIFRMNFIVSMFVDVFKRFSGELVVLTQWVTEVCEAFD